MKSEALAQEWKVFFPDKFLHQIKKVWQRMVWSFERVASMVKQIDRKKFNLFLFFTHTHTLSQNTHTLSFSIKHTHSLSKHTLKQHTHKHTHSLFFYQTHTLSLLNTHTHGFSVSQLYWVLLMLMLLLLLLMLMMCLISVNTYWKMLEMRWTQFILPFYPHASNSNPLISKKEKIGFFIVALTQDI